MNVDKLPYTQEYHPGPGFWGLTLNPLDIGQEMKPRHPPHSPTIQKGLLGVQFWEPTSEMLSKSTFEESQVQLEGIELFPGTIHSK